MVALHLLAVAEQVAQRVLGTAAQLLERAALEALGPLPGQLLEARDV
jgi:hypothetical protein